VKKLKPGDWPGFGENDRGESVYNQNTTNADECKPLDEVARRRAFVEEMRASRKRAGFAKPPIIPPTPGFLTPEHRARLDRALTPEIIAGRRYVSILEENVSWLATQGYESYQRGTGLFIPRWPVLSTDFDGRPVPDGSQLRRDKPRTQNAGKDKPRKIVKYETPVHQGSCLDVHPSNRERLRDLHTELWATEGLVKADAGASHGMLVISLLGVWNWLGRDGRGGASAALPDFDALGLKERIVITIFDADSRINKHVYDALVRFSGYLRKRGAHVAIRELESGDLEDYWTNE
jgi:Domain of unknown function (DUF3854)